jgi:tRNA threonylcarbamoyladenosine biosynthesis protein TsaE
MKRAYADVDALRRAGKRLGEILQPGDAVALEGPLGAGKTTLVQGIAEGLGVKEPVTSPTFTLMNVYEGRLPLYHLDVYRLEDPARLELLGYEPDQAETGVTLVEWADKMWPFWSDDVLRVQLRHLPAGRELEARALGRNSEKRLDAWAKNH